MTTHSYSLELVLEPPAVAATHRNRSLCELRRATAYPHTDMRFMAWVDLDSRPKHSRQKDFSPWGPSMKQSAILASSQAF